MWLAVDMSNFRDKTSIFFFIVQNDEPPPRGNTYYILLSFVLKNRNWGKTWRSRSPWVNPTFPK